MRDRLLSEYSNFFREKLNHCELFTITVSFKCSYGSKGVTNACLDTYDFNILRKIRKQLWRNYKKNLDTIPYEYFRYHEYDEKSIFKRDSMNTPNHIHGILPIDKKYMGNFWNYELKRVNTRIVKDIKSLRYVSSLLIEPMRSDELSNWINYCLKKKNMENI
ncbi:MULTISPECIES: hypothetical protein [unclassified Polynucleobacter]|jgi:hypothetical protein|uniref:hypothetical protein n=1 Tax=unclassified Polynucleobacter TaxID=2640945 RepID=UPI0008CA0BB1|nr:MULTISPECIES: hypothetical protein [unclassified Polynucleobacter]OHC10718.1 MAG: hypothetical protein A2X74_02480 [Polynucleobacter sp. GWA2_45_21]HBK44714.1 hypothetical protein [Polynucleobacter sp.]